MNFCTKCSTPLKKIWTVNCPRIGWKRVPVIVETDGEDYITLCRMCADVMEVDLEATIYEINMDLGRDQWR